MMKSLFLCLLAAPAAAFDYSIIGAGDIVLTDEQTGITDLKTIFVGEDTIVSLSGLEWNATGAVAGSDNLLFCETFLDGTSVAKTNVSLADVGRELPSDAFCGTLTVPEGGRYLIDVVVTVDESEASTAGEYEAYGSGVSILPLLVILGLAVTTHMVEFSLFAGVFIGACIVYGSLNAGFKSTLDYYILNALTDEGHVFVILFTLFLSGLVAMMEKSGGMFGFTRDIGYYAKTARAGQVACFCVGVIVFFDDYANTLLAGKSLRPLLDTLFVSREKLSFLVDATAAPIASISPISSWVGFEIGLIQAELDKIIEQEGTEDIGIKTSGFAVFLQSIKYRYYPIFMLLLIPILIFTQRDFSTMLIAERKTQVYKRTDGGDAATNSKKPEHEVEEFDVMSSLTKSKADADDQEKQEEALLAGNPVDPAKTAPKEFEHEAKEEFGDDNAPRKGTPLASWNMLVPILLLIILIFYLLVKSGETGEPNQSVMDKIENSDSYVALLYGTMAAAMITLMFYLAQIVSDGHFVWPNVQYLREAFTAGYATDADPSRARFLMSLRESVDAMILGFARIFPALIVLTLAWATGDMMTSVGADRLFAKWITGGIPPETLPTLSFVIAMLMALATGTSWGTMTILFPLLLVPTYNASDGDEQIFYSVVAGILSGSVAGDHMSPISDTTVLSSLASDCNLLAHVGTQAPYVVFVSIISILVGTVPIGYDVWPNIVGILLGLVLIIAFVYFICAPIFSPTGKFDIFNEWYFKMRPSEEIETLRQDTAKACAGEEPEPAAEGMNQTEMSMTKQQAAPAEGENAPSSEEQEEVVAA